jgi:hypothetical protein
MKSSTPGRGPLAQFIAQYGKKVIGVLEGFDRVRVHGTLRHLYSESVMNQYLLTKGVPFKDFKSHVLDVTCRIRSRAAEFGKRLGRPVIYLHSGAQDKEALAREIMARDQIREGLIAIFSAVEPCRTWTVHGNRETKQLDLKMKWGKCTHLYFYFLHARLGFLNVRLQTWFPFLIQICFNGREWLARQLDARGWNYERRDNCLPWVEKVEDAQKLLNQQVRTNWQQLLEPLAKVCHPCHREICQPMNLSYYWTVGQSEYATDVMFKSRRDLEAIYPAMVHHSMMTFGSEDVLRFMDREKSKTQNVKTDRRRRSDGVRVKHWIDENSLKLYDKGSVLRSEVTINNPDGFTIWRTSERDPNGPASWRPLRRTVADVPRRAEVCQGATHRHLEALASIKVATPLGQQARSVCKRRRKDGRSYRALQPLGDDAQLLEAVNRQEFVVAGFRNRDIHRHLYGPVTSAQIRRKQTAAIGRKLALLRAHGLIRKVPNRHLYHVTTKGRHMIAALLSAKNASTEQLAQLAA